MSTETLETAPALSHDDDGSPIIRLPYSVDLLAGMFAVQLHCADRREVTPVIQAVRVDARSFIATQRYTVGEWTHDAAATAGSTTPTDNEYVLVPQAAALWLSKQLPKALGQLESMLVARKSEERDLCAWVVFTPVSITIRWGEMILAVTRFDRVGGNFPPVARLFPESVPTEPGAPVICLKPQFIELFTKGAARYLERESTIRFSFLSTGNPSKPGPVFIESVGTDCGTFRGLLQPMLLLR